MGLMRAARAIADRMRGTRAEAPPAPPASASLSCRMVRDEEVSASYPGNVRRDYLIYDWGKSAPPGEPKTMTVFEVENAIVPGQYLAADPARELLFRNLSYGSLPFGIPDIRAGGSDVIDFATEDLQPLAGRIVLIGGAYEFNFFHGLLNWFSRFVLLQEMAPHLLADPDTRFLVDASGQHEPMRSILAALGVPADRLVFTDVTTRHCIERAVLVSLIHEGEVCPEIFRLLAKRIRANLGIGEATRGSRRIWISREHFPQARRRILNFDALAPLLDAHGFERIVLEELSFAEQVRLFAEAEIIVGSHGAGFANMIFCSPDVRLVVIENDVTRFTKIDRLFAGLAAGMGLTCETPSATTVKEDGIDYDVFVNSHFADAIAKVDEVTAAIERAVDAVRRTG